MLINRIPVNQKLFATDKDYKFYLLDDEKDIIEAARLDYDIKPIESLEYFYDQASDLRFINNWKLTIQYANQYEKAVFIYE